MRTTLVVAGFAQLAGPDWTLVIAPLWDARAPATVSERVNCVRQQRRQPRGVALHRGEIAAIALTTENAAAIVREGARNRAVLWISGVSPEPAPSLQIGVASSAPRD